MKTFAVVCASGIGDALLMQIFASHLHKLGHAVTVFSNHLTYLSEWFPGFSFAPQPPLDQIDSLFGAFDGIVLQHDNTPKSKQIRALAKPIYTLYGAHLVSKHGLFRPQFDYLFKRSDCMAENVRLACQALFPDIPATRDNGLVPLPHLSFRRYAKRIAIHPTSTSPDKNWPKYNFLKLKERLLREGYDPVFIVSPAEAQEWESPQFPHLAALASFLYESGYLIGNDSGPGHLASNLGLPTLTIGPSLSQLALWRPGWAPGLLAYPPSFINKFKLTRSNWKLFVSVNQVIKQFMKLSMLK